MNPKVLYLTYDGLTDPLGQSQILPYLEGLSQKGYHITIISFEKPDRFKEQKAFIEAQIKNAGLTWFPQIYHKNPSILATIRDIRKMQKEAFRLFRHQSYDIVHCRSYIPALVGLKMKNKLATRFIFDMRGFWPDERVESELWNLKNPVYRLIYQYFKKKETEFLKNADHIISLTHTAKAILLKKSYLRLDSGNISVIPCCVDLKLFNSQKEKGRIIDPAFQKHSGEFILSYLGSTGTWYMLPEMLLFFKILLQYFPNARFLFITQDNPEIIQKNARQKDIPSEKIVVQPATREEVPGLLQQSEASIAFIKPVFSKKASSPTKLGEVLAMGIPMIVNKDVGDNDRIIQHGYNGLNVDEMNKKNFHHLLQNYDLNNFSDQETIQNTAKKWFALENGIMAYAQIYSNMNYGSFDL